VIAVTRDNIESLRLAATCLANCEAAHGLPEAPISVIFTVRASFI
jgi:hypothetical protein